ncbi:MAG: glycosyltransferase family 1 protein, partial [bacterium]|nr:glycosyltransferase family 1 protein [bacterium]
MPEVAGSASAGGAVFVDPYSVDDIVKGMKEIKNQELRIKLVKLGFENVKRFSWEKCARETLEVLEGI